MFSSEWESAYSSGTHDSVWPWSDLVSAVMRNVRTAGLEMAQLKVLELGCGAGANVGFFGSQGCLYHGVDGSKSVIDRLRTRFKANENLNFSALDFTSAIPEDKFNIFVDRSSLTHNSTSAIKKSLELCRAAAAKDAYFFGIDWFSTEHSDYGQGEYIEDKYTKAKAKAGQFQGLGRVHFSDAAHLKELFDSTGWTIKSLEHKAVKTLIPDSLNIFASYNLVARPR